MKLEEIIIQLFISNGILLGYDFLTHWDEIQSILGSHRLENLPKRIHFHQDQKLQRAHFLSPSSV